MSFDSWAPNDMKGAYKNCYYFLIKCTSQSSVIYQLLWHPDKELYLRIRWMVTSIEKLDPK